MTILTTTTPTQRQYPCGQCGARLEFAPGTNGCGVANYTLSSVPAGTTHVSAKTAWHLRQRQAVTWAGGQATVNFQLSGGDLDDSNLVDIFDYFHLASAWYQPNDAADIDGSGMVDLDDYLILSNHWYQQGSPE